MSTHANNAAFTVPPGPGSVSVFARGVAPFIVSLGLAFALQFLLRPGLDDYDAGLVMNAGINIMLAVSLTIVNGFTGQFSIGHAGFLGVGGYVAGSITYYASTAIYGNASTHGSVLSGTTLDVDPSVLTWMGSGDWLFVGAVLMGGLVAAGVGYVVGLPSLRLRGDYLAIVTLGFGEIVRVVIQRTGNVMKPQMIAWDQVHPGLSVPPGAEKVLAYQFTRVDAVTHAPVTVYQAVSDTHFWEVMLRVGGSLGFSATPDYTSMFWVGIAACITLVVAFRLKRGTFGRAFLSIREDEVASEAMGVDTTKYKVRAFMIAAFFAGIAGGLYAHLKSMNPNEIGFSRSFDIVIMVVLGGLGSISGAAIAAVIVTFLPEWLRGLRPDAGTLMLVLGGVVLAGAGAKGLVARASRHTVTRATMVVAAVGVVLVIAGLVGLFTSMQALQFKVELGSYRMIIFALALVLMMIFRPKGLLGVREVWDASIWREFGAFFGRLTGKKGAERG